MKHSHHFLALLPLFSILTMSPMQLESSFAQRSIASVEESIVEGEVKVSAHPKYEARAAKIDKSKIEIDADLDLNCFSDRGDDLRKRLMEMRKDYKVDVVEKGAVELQKIRVQGLVEGLVALEVDFAALKEKKAFLVEGEKIAEGTMNELKTTLESLLIDELENDFIVLKEEVKQKEKEEVIVKEEPTKEEKEQSEDEKRICELEDKNKVLNEQVEKLLAEQKKILETMLGMNNMMIQMQQNQQQQQPQIPSWLMAGSLVNPQLQYPYMQSPTVIMINNGAGPSDQLGLIGGQQLGAQNYQQNLQSGQYQLQQQPSYFGPNPYQPYDPRFAQPAPIMPGPFGNAPFLYNFGPTPFNQAPIQTA